MLKRESIWCTITTVRALGKAPVWPRLRHVAIFLVLKFSYIKDIYLHCEARVSCTGENASHADIVDKTVQTTVIDADFPPVVKV